jgi:hypothetical protein
MLVEAFMGRTTHGDAGGAPISDHVAHLTGLALEMPVPKSDLKMTGEVENPARPR